MRRVYASFIAGLMAAASRDMPLFMSPIPVIRSRRPALSSKRSRWRDRGRQYPANGVRECARRRRQIGQGIITEANGLIRRA